MKKKVLKICVWIPVIIVAVGIFGFSSQEGESSGSTSRRVANVLIDVADSIHLVDVRWNGREQLVEKLQVPIRKAAHITEYALLAALIYTALAVDGLKWKFTGYAAFGISVLFACSDEFHQLFVPGRSGLAADVLIDASGILIAVLICAALDRRKKIII